MDHIDPRCYDLDLKSTKQAKDQILDLGMR